MTKNIRKYKLVRLTIPILEDDNDNDDLITKFPS